MTLGCGLMGKEWPDLERWLNVGRDFQEEHLVGRVHVDTILRYFCCP